MKIITHKHRRMKQLSVTGSSVRAFMFVAAWRLFFRLSSSSPIQINFCRNVKFKSITFSCYLQHTVKGRAVPVHTIKAYGGIRGIAPFILDLSITWRFVVQFTPWPLYPGNFLRHQLSRRLSGPQRGFGRFWRRENLLSLPVFGPPTDLPVA
jgi:hypothetical protein